MLGFLGIASAVQGLGERFFCADRVDSSSASFAGMQLFHEDAAQVGPTLFASFASLPTLISLPPM